jgi:hypothetical protein
MNSIKMLMAAAISFLALSSAAQDTARHNGKMKTHAVVQTKYACPMHPEVTSDKPGKCSKCGMSLQKTEKQGEAKLYVCPMHPEVTSDKPGKCSKCGMNLKETEKHGDAKLYVCPMHPEVTSDKPGKCSKCGMELKEKREDHSGHNH